MSHNVLIPSVVIQFCRRGSLGGVCPWITSCQILISFPLPGTQCNSDTKNGITFLQIFAMEDPFLIAGSTSIHLSLGPWKYLLFNMQLLQDGLGTIIFESSLAPIAKFWNFKSLMWRPPSDQSCLIVIQLTKVNFLPPHYFLLARESFSSVLQSGL